MAGLSKYKAGVMLKEGTAQGHPLTAKQKRLFGFIRGGGKPTKLDDRKEAVRRATA